MQISLAGVLVCVGLLLISYRLGAPIVIALFASLAFGSTAIGTLPSLGGSSPLIYSVFVVLLLVYVAARKNAFRDLGAVLAVNRTAWIVCGLTVYAFVGAAILPRLFAGRTTAFVASRTLGVVEVPLGPVSGNITQVAYFSLGVLAFFAFSILLMHDRHFETVRRGFFTLAVLHASLGVIDLTAKLVGAGDVLFPIRTASYVLLTESTEAGFWRVTGAYSEASAFGGTTLAISAFAYTYWKATSSGFALGLTLALFMLLVLSTSSTAYAGLAILAAVVVGKVSHSAVRDRITTQDLILLGVISLGATLGLLLYLHNERLFDPLVQLFQSTVLNKSSSASGQERAYWNYKSMQSFFDTSGLGIGLGSSRSSNWMIAVVSQLGLIGALMFAVLVTELARGLGRTKVAQADFRFVAVARSARAYALASLVAATIAGGTADPGLLFFVALATVQACRARMPSDLMTLVQRRPSAPVMRST